MQQLALNVPQYGNIPNTGLNPVNLGISDYSLGSVVGAFLNLVFYFSFFLTFIWFIWGAYEYMVAQGQKEGLAHARDRMRWAIVGFAVLIMAFLVGNYAPTIFPFIRSFYNNASVPQIQTPNGTIQTAPCNQAAGAPC